MGLWTDPDARNGSSYEWLHQPTRPMAPPPPPPPPPPPRRRGRGFVAAVLAGTVAVAALTSGAVILLTGAAGGGADDVKAVAPLPVSKGGTGTTRANEIYKRVSSGVVSIKVTT